MPDDRGRDPSEKQNIYKTSEDIDLNKMKILANENFDQNRENLGFSAKVSIYIFTGYSITLYKWLLF